MMKISRCRGTVLRVKRELVDFVESYFEKIEHITFNKEREIKEKCTEEVIREKELYALEEEMRRKLETVKT